MAGGRVVASLNARVGLNATQYERGAQRINRANREMARRKEALRRAQQNLNREWGRFTSTARTVATRIAVVQAAVFAATRTFAAMGDELGKMSDRLGLSIGQLQSLQLAAESVNVPFTRAARAIQTLQVRFARLGLDTSSFRTELTALDPALLAQLDNIEDINEAYRVYTERLTQLQREGRTLEATQLAQAGFGQGAAQSGLQVLGQERTARETLLGAGALLTEEDKSTLAETAQSFTDLTAIIKNQMIVVTTNLSENIITLNRTLQDFLTGPIPNIINALIFGVTGLGAARLLRGGGNLLKRARDYFRRSEEAGGIPRPGPGGLLSGGLGIGGLIYGYGFLDDLQDDLETRQDLQSRLIGFGPEQVAALRRLTGRAPVPSDRALVQSTARDLLGDDYVDSLIEGLDLDEPKPTYGYQGLIDQRIRNRTRATADGIQVYLNDADRRYIARRQRSIDIVSANNRVLEMENDRQIDALLRARLNELRLYYDAVSPDIDADTDGGTDTSGVDRATEERRAALDRLRFRGVLGGRDLAADLDLSPLTEAGEAARANRRRRQEFLASRVVSAPVGARDLGADLDLTGLDEAFVERAELLLQTYRLFPEPIKEANTEMSRMDELLADITDTIEGSESAFRSAFVDSLLEGKLQLESFRGILRQVIAELLDALFVKQLVSGISNFIATGIGSVGGSGGSDGPPPGGPIPGPGAVTSSVPVPTPAPAFVPRVAAASGPPVNIIVNGVEDAAAFARVSAAVRAELVPQVTQTLAANANRPGPVRAIRGR